MLDPFGLISRRLRAPSVGKPHPVHPGWPELTPAVTTVAGIRVQLRPLRRGDGEDWCQQRLLDESWLRPVEPTGVDDWETAHTKAAWREHIYLLNAQARAGEIIPFAIDADGQFAGQLTLGGIQHGSAASCWVGYWVASPFMGQGIATAAVALGVDHAFARVGLHRVTASYLPENAASGQVLVTNGFRREGLLRGFLHVAGEWRDHYQASVLDDDYSAAAVERLRQAGRLR
ncbi:GNAT family N-acetyltransferase [Corynebacterium sp. MNWGS58]|uniref:GNAT family N-acetyltransferase n=1 Tax=Corynebacterium sp. 102791.4 TaxID=3104612 RepID=UPI003515B642